MSYVNCKLCPRECGIDRTAGEMGYCRCPDTAMVAKTMLHKWEEPALAGNGGSGAIFFGGCTLGCKYCQNRAISGAPVGKPMESAALRQVMEDLIAQGAENIDLVTPTQYLPTIRPALYPKLPATPYISDGFSMAIVLWMRFLPPYSVLRTLIREKTRWRSPATDRTILLPKSYGY